LVKGLALGLPWDLAGRLGSIAAAYALEQPGPQSHCYSLADFLSRFQAQFGYNARLAALFQVEDSACQQR
jgi:adenosine kinase